MIYRSDGFVLTNNHVVEGAEEVWVTLQDNRSFPAEVVGTYAPADLAVLKIDAVDLPVLPLADSDEARVGAWVLAVGNPLELGATVTAGIISAKGRDIDIIQDNYAIESFIQTDAVVNPGNSGGALVDVEGRLLGINTAIATSTGFYEGYSFAIPVNLARKIADDIIAYGSYQRGFLGVNITELDDELAERLGLDRTRGVVVTGVVPGSAAEDAGIQLNDVILEVDGHPVLSAPALLEYIGRARIGQTLHLTLDRHGKKLQIAVALRGIE
ncbi:MAG: PDZ domain-containing protein [Bacteroidetes bacterium]|nr:MAG: PDZ domain-containing protein [Bacteroidota bacterium]